MHRLAAAARIAGDVPWTAGQSLSSRLEAHLELLEPLLTIFRNAAEGELVLC